jgi:hypothetical protein
MEATMRKDMNKLLCERPRGGRRLKTKRTLGRHFDWESAPTRAPMPGWIRRSKGLNENLQPLERFLRSRVGRPWDLVYAEIRADLKVTRAIDLHILQHLDHMVHTKVRIIDGVLEAMDNVGWGKIGANELYVCPRTGQLRRFQPARGRVTATLASSTPRPPSQPSPPCTPSTPPREASRRARKP